MQIILGAVIESYMLYVVMHMRDEGWLGAGRVREGQNSSVSIHEKCLSFSGSGGGGDGPKTSH